jgi:hypothetical protein
MKRLAGLLLLVAVFPLSSCAVQKTVTREGLVTDPAPSQVKQDFAGAPGQRVSGYATNDGVVHAFDGRAWIEGDAMVFDRPERRQGMGRYQPAVRKRVALSELASVHTAITDSTRSVLAGAAIVVVMASIGLAGMTASSFGQ